MSSEKKYSSTEFIRFASRRSVVHSTHGMVACTQPLAAQAGIRILKEGGNAADAAVAVAAVLSVTEPCSTGIGGDLFCLYFNPRTKSVQSLNASGRSPSALTLDYALSTIPESDLKISNNRIPPSSAHTVTVPGAAAGWCDTVRIFGSGKLTLAQVLAPAIEYAEEGFPVSQISAQLWSEGEMTLKHAGPNSGELLKDGIRAPSEGEFMRMPNMAKTYRELGQKGKKAFYEGRIAEEIVKAVQARGGVLSLEDLARHGEIGSEVMKPINLEIPWGEDEGFGKKTVWECAPNGQGLVALQTLGILEALQKRGVIPEIGSPEGYKHNSVEHLHAVISALRIAFADAGHYVCDPNTPGTTPLKGLLSKEYLSSRSKLFDPAHAGAGIEHGAPPEEARCDTVYFCVADKEGGGCSFINSVFTAFGSGIVPKGCGFALHNRGCGFVLSPPDHSNVLAPNKRPYHTIIPAVLTTPLPATPNPILTLEPATPLRLDTLFGVMGGYMQPQGHVQVLLNLLAFKMTVQEALDAPRICIGPNYTGPVASTDTSSNVVVNAERGVGREVVEGLKRLGYAVRDMEDEGEDSGRIREMFGRGQVIRGREEVEEDGGRKVRVWWGGSDMRGDGHCVGY
ncbi:nucleophile aminohydrolase [Kalaharituber pfeilii]|nr:nucleophile aminohydrolase [Kalaharituber pfeilii]